MLESKIMLALALFFLLPQFAFSVTAPSDSALLLIGKSVAVEEGKFLSGLPFEQASQYIHEDSFYSGEQLSDKKILDEMKNAGYRVTPSSKIPDGFSKPSERVDPAEETVKYSVPSKPSACPNGQKIVDEAMKHIGLHYVWGGESLSTGADCSGFVHAVATKVLGKVFPYRMGATDQYKFLQQRVSKDSLLPGDLLFFSKDGGSYMYHVGIYAGDGKFVHASGKKTGVKVSSLSGYYSTRLYAAKRVAC
ncbi:MAG: C40 family peptidase [Candidatus Micrarchaeota archaeon]